MSDEDRDLTESMLATDEGPRPGWVAALRAEFESSFDVPVGPRRFTPTARPPMNSALSLSLGAAASIALLFVVAFWHSSSDSPGKVLPAPPSSTTSPTAPAGTGPRTIATTSCPYDMAGAADSQVVTAGSSVWVLNKCFDGHFWQGIEIVEIDAESGKVLGSRRLPLTDLDMPQPVSRLGVHFVGVVERRVILYLEDLQRFSAYTSVDVDSGVVAPLAIPSESTLVGLVGNVIITGGHEGNNPDGSIITTIPDGTVGPGLFTSIDTLDLVSGSTTSRPVSGTPDAGHQAGTIASPDARWMWTVYTSDLTRMDADGTTHKLDRFVGSIYPSGVVAAHGNVWVAIEDPTAGQSPSLVRIDPNDGHALTRPVPMPAGSQTASMFDTLHASAHGLLITDPSSGWWWSDNDGTIDQLAVPDGAFVAIVDDRILVVDATGQVVVHTVGELAAAS